MAVLDVFEILFRGDAKDLKKGAQEAEKSTKGLGEEVKKTDKVSERLGATFLDTVTSAQGALAALFSIGAITAGVVAQAAATDELGKFSQTLGLNIEDVGAWEEAVIRSGGTADGFRGTIAGLQDGLTEMTLTGGGPAVEVFARLGIQATDAGGKVKSAFEILPEIAESFEGLSAAESAAFGQQLGLDQGTILLLQQGKVGVEELVRKQKELGVVTQEDAKVAGDFNDAIANSQQAFGSFFRGVVTSLLPSFTSVINGLNEVIVFFKENEEFTKNFFIGAAGAITIFYLPAIISAAAATALAIAPFIIGAAVAAALGAAFALLYEDIQLFLSGSESFIGTVSKKWPAVGETVKEIVEVVGSAFDAFKELFDFISGAFSEGIGKAFEDLKGFLGFGGKDVVVKAEKKGEKAPQEDTTGKQPEQEVPPVIQAAIKGEKAAQEAAQNPLTAQRAEAIATTSKNTQKSTSVSVGAVNVDARGGDSKEVAANVGSALKDQMQNTVSNFDDGVMA